MNYNLTGMNSKFKREEFATRLKNFGFEIIKLTRKLPKNEMKIEFFYQIKSSDLPPQLGQTMLKRFMGRRGRNLFIA